MLTVDADGHVLEPRDTWLEYLEPQWRDRAIRIENDSDGNEVLLVDGRPLESLRGRMASLGGIELDPTEALTTGSLTYEDGCPPGGYDPAARLKVMDSERIDVAMLYPTIGICWEGLVTDGALATAYTRAYNRYIVEFCNHDRKRLVPVAHLSLLDVDGAIEEAHRARADGCVSAYLSPDMQARDDKSLSDPSFDPFWATLADLDMPVGFHVVVRDRPFFRQWMPGRGTEGSGLFFFAFLAIDVMAAFTQMLSTGVFDRHPKLRCAVLETGATWISAWLDRMDHKHEVMHATTPGSLKPSEYFYRQCIVSADPDETVIAPIVEAVGAEYFIWASDYPHIDASFGVVGEIRSRIASLSEADQRLVMGENAAAFYNLDAAGFT